MVKKGTKDKKKRHIGQYEVIKAIAKGGMGEVFLAKDLTCNRIVALKKIRTDYLKKATVHKRFLREAHLTAQLSHPAIIPIYSIHTNGKSIYYTMPHIEGKTLRALIHETKQKERKGIQHSLGSSIPALMRLFLTVCEAINYAHVKGILHRDIKPENIIVGKYGEVMILDWGLIDAIDPPEVAKEMWGLDTHALTKPGKIAGTLPFMAPERAFGAKPSETTDIYSLGVMLYQLLTLRLPFLRTTVEKFRKTCKHERLLEPREIAPYRDIPDHLANIAKKCLHTNPQERFHSVSELISSLKHYVEGQFEWVETAQLDPENKNDWEFQENIPLAKHIAISQEINVHEWVYLMVSKEGISGNTKVTTRIRLKRGGSGLGILLSVPETSQRKSLEEGYCLWLSSTKKQNSKLYRNNVEVYDATTITLKENQWYTLSIEKIENDFHFSLNDKPAFHYSCHLPLRGTHLGLLFRDTDFEMESLKIYTASHNATINCLSVPDAFLAAKNFTLALSEYRKIGTSFLGRTEGREALFRAGLTLLEEGKSKTTKKGQTHLFLAALDEFGKLHGTPAAPMEYLGKALVYREMNDIEEEVKCLELCLRKLPKHPLLPPVIEHITFRLHETSDMDRKGAYHFALLTLRFLPELFEQKSHKRLLKHLTEHWTKLPFLEKSPKQTLIALAFFQAKPLALREIAHENKSTEKDCSNALFALATLGCYKLLPKNLPDELAPLQLPLLEALEKSLSLRPSFKRTRLLAHLFRKGIDEGQSQKLLPYFAKLKSKTPHVKQLYIEALLFAGKEKEVKKHLASARSRTQEMTSQDLLPWEKMNHLRELILISHCLGKKDRVKLYRRQLKNLTNAVAKT